MTEVVRSYAEANRELAESFDRYMLARGFSVRTVESYDYAVERFVEGMGSVSVLQTRRADVHTYLSRVLKRGASAATAANHTCALRCFFKFLCLGGLIGISPMLQVGFRKIPKRLPRVLTVEEVERIIGAADTPAGRAIIETMYSTGVRISELVGMRLENVDFENRTIKVLGKGNRERYVLFGSKAAEAIREYLKWRPSEAGFLFESAAREGSLQLLDGKYWGMRFYVRNGKQQPMRVGTLDQFPTEETARAQWEKIKANIPAGKYTPNKGKQQGPYTTRGVRLMVVRLARKAGVKGVHPHAFRRAMACHMLAHGADIRAIQELLGHKLISTTMIYTTLTNEKMQEIHARFHPHAESNGDANAEKD